VRSCGRFLSVFASRFAVIKAANKVLFIEEAHYCSGYLQALDAIEKILAVQVK
jgi:hypothetical protein